MFTIRPISAQDKDQWVQLWSGPDSYVEFNQASHKMTSEVTNTTFSRFLDESKPMHAAVAVDEAGTLIGFVTYVTHMNTWIVEEITYLNDLFVSSKARLQGVGRKLIEYVYQDADRLGAKRVYWNSQFENHRAQMLYTKVGKKSGQLLYVRP